MGRYQQLTIKQVVSKFIDGSLSPQLVVDNALKEANKFGILNAFIRTTPELAREQAEQSAHRYDKGKPLGPLDGVPIALKDNFCTKGVLTTCASKMLENFVPPYNATVYERLLNAGAVLIGKTNMDEFAMGSGTVDSIFGPTKNVWSGNLSENNWHISGGSSGGSATAVAAGICYAAIGSDTGGSTRNPASYCGIVGLKPSYGLVSRFGLIPLVNSMDVPGILTRNVDDCSIVLNAIAGPDSRDSTMLGESYEPFELPAVDRIHIRNIRVGIPKEYYCASLSTEVVNVWKEVGDMLDLEGANVQDISMPNTKYSNDVYSVLNQSDIASNMARYDGIKYGYRADVDTTYEDSVATTRNEGFNDVVKERILMGNFFLLRENYNTYYEKAMRIRRLIAEDFNRVFGGTNEQTGVDVILTPTTLADAPYYRDFVAQSNRYQCAMHDFCTLPANMAGIPAVSLPIRLSEHGLPISLQLMSQSQNERILLTVAKWIESKLNFYILQSNHIHKIRE